MNLKGPNDGEFHSKFLFFWTWSIAQYSKTRPEDRNRVSSQNVALLSSNIERRIKSGTTSILNVILLLAKWRRDQRWSAKRDVTGRELSTSLQTDWLPTRRLVSYETCGLKSTTTFERTAYHCTLSWQAVPRSSVSVTDRVRKPNISLKFLTSFAVT